MNLPDLFRAFFRFQQLGKKSAQVAKERLRIVLSHQSTDGQAPKFLAKLREEMLAVIQKHAPIDPADITIQLQHQDNCAVLELNIALPREALQLCCETESPIEPNAVL